MPARFRFIDRDTPMLLPADLRDWVPANHIVHFILDAVAALPLAAFSVNWRGSGNEQYPPAMMLALLIYCYATGRSSSRQIEAATHSDVAVRYLCANTHPDHSVICTFRTQNRDAFKAAFTAVLQMAREVRLEQVGTVSVDGTKVLANASKHAAVSYQRAGQMIEELELEVEQLLQKAEAADATPLRDGLSVPEEIARRQQRQEALRAARAVIEARAQEAAAVQQAAYEAKRAARAERRARGETVRGPEPKPPSKDPQPTDQYNFTDPPSAIMKAGSGQHFEQAYNAQLAVDGRMLIVGERVSDAPNDKRELPATVAAIEPSVRVAAVLTDSGFYREAAVAAVERNAGGEPSGMTVYAAVEKTGHHRRVADLEAKADPPAPPAGASATEVMKQRVATAAGRALYGLRKQTVEPVIGIIKEAMGFRRFRLRGLAKVSLEWTLVCVSYNFKRLFNLRAAMATA
jgi:transposase